MSNNNPNKGVEQRPKTIKDSLIDYTMSFLPKDVSDTLREHLRKELSLRIGAVVAEGLDEFCKRKDICRICITGGYHCDSDHK